MSKMNTKKGTTVVRNLFCNNSSTPCNEGRKETQARRTADRGHGRQRGGGKQRSGDRKVHIRQKEQR